MTTVTANIAISLDGYAAGPEQSEENPLGLGFSAAHRWMFDAPEDNADEIASILGHDAYIMGRNMFGPVRGPWPNLDWRGWWGEEPPYHAPVFVLTHHPREPLVMDGGTTFTFVAGVTEAYTRALDAAGPSGTVSIAGGAATLRQYLRAGLVDQLRLHVAPFMVGAGEKLLDGLTEVNLRPVSARATPLVTHLVYDIATSVAADPAQA